MVNVKTVYCLILVALFSLLYGLCGFLLISEYRSAGESRLTDLARESIARLSMAGDIYVRRGQIAPLEALARQTLEHPEISGVFIRDKNLIPLVDLREAGGGGVVALRGDVGTCGARRWI
jgi:hypothetical protein